MVSGSSSKSLKLHAPDVSPKLLSLLAGKGDGIVVECFYYAVCVQVSPAFRFGGEMNSSAHLSWRNWCVVLITIVVIALPLCLCAQTPRDQAWKVLQDGVKNEDQRQRAIATRSLGLVPGDSIAEKLATEALSDEDVEVRISAAAALGQMQAHNSIPALQKALKDQQVGVILAAASSLKSLGNPSAYLVYYAVLTGERKSGEGLMAE